MRLSGTGAVDNEIPLTSPAKQSRQWASDSCPTIARLPEGQATARAGRRTYALRLAPDFWIDHIVTALKRRERSVSEIGLLDERTAAARAYTALRLRASHW